jgi:hypothetical protein
MKVSNIKNYVYVVDVETNGLEATPESFVFGCVYSHTEKYVFEELDKLKNFLLTLKKGSWVFAHNGEYDYTCIFGNIINMDRQPLFVKSKFMCFTVNDIKFADSMNIYPTSLSELGKAMGLEKGITPDKFKTKQKVKQTTIE